MQARIVHTVTIDQQTSKKPWAFRPTVDPQPPAAVVLHDEARWFLDRAPRLPQPQGIGFCGIMTVSKPADRAPATIYLWPLQTPHTITAGVKKDVPGMTDLKPWPADVGFPSWADDLMSKPEAALKFFKQDDKNLHVIPAAHPLPGAPAHSQFQQAIQALEDTADLKFLGFSLYYNLALDKKALTFTPNQHLLRCLSRSQNGKYFTNLGGPEGTLPDNWAATMKHAFDTYFNGNQ